MKNIRTRLLLAAAYAFFLAAVSVQAANLTVNSAADDGTGTCTANKCTLRDAILTATSGRTIDFSLPANTIITLTNGQLFIDKNLNIIGPGANLLTIQRSTADGTPTFHIFNVNGTVLFLFGVTISNGLTSGADNDHGGGIYNNGGTLNITACALSGNSGAGASGDGGGVYSSGTTTISNSLISNNGTGTAGSGGGVFSASGTVTIDNSTVTGNHANNGGGIAPASGGTITITNSTVAANTAGGLGGGIYNQGTLNVKNTIVANNTAIQGPDISGTVTSQGYNLIRSTANTTITGVTTGNQLNTDPKLDILKDNGGPTRTFALATSSPAIDAGNSSGSTSDQRGFNRPVNSPTINDASGGDGSDIGAFEVQPDQLSGCSQVGLVVKNTSDTGADSLRFVIAGACSGSTITFAGTASGAISLTSGQIVIDKNLTINGPGANVLKVQRDPSAPSARIFDIAANRNVTIKGLTISNGALPNGTGGAILNSGTLTLVNDTVSLNSAIGGNGGAIYNSGTLTISGSTLSDNKIDSASPGSGGAIFNFGATITITNSTLSGNSAVSPGRTSDHGGAIYSNVGSVTIRSSTIAGNSSDNGGGLMGANGAVITTQNTIIALNATPTGAAGPDVNGPLTSQGFNIFGDPNGMTLTGVSQQSDQQGVSAAQLNLGGLQDNGGPTFTRALLPGSVAVDKGNYIGLATDQRGFARTVDMPDIANYAFGGDGTDIGAFELQLPPPSPTPSPTPTATPGSLGNISTRLQVGTGNNVLFAGFIIQGNASKTVLIRSAGPSLAAFGLPGAMSNPQLDLHDANNIIGMNDNWQTTQLGGVITSDQVAAIQNSGAAPSDPAEPAILATLSAGSYTAIVQGVGGTQGVATVEVYDLSPNNGAILANISTRGFIQTGDNVMIGGFINVGNSSRVLIRATGPSLSAFGINNALADPRIELHDANGTLAGNDDWQTTQVGGIITSDQSAAIQNSGLAPSNPAESAIIATLAPGSYTAIAQGVNGGTGVGLIEVFALP